MEAEPQALFKEAMDPNRMEIVHSGVANREEFVSQTISEGLYLHTLGLGLDPLTQGNPANVKCRLVNKKGDSVVCVRTPSPTDGRSQITPEFKAFLRHLKSQEKKYTYVNLQTRTKPPLWKKIAGWDEEYLRSKSIEDLSKDPEFADVLTVVTLDKNSPFHRQVPSKEALAEGIKQLDMVMVSLDTEEKDMSWRGKSSS